jgi:hypothetical protein
VDRQGRDGDGFADGVGREKTKERIARGREHQRWEPTKKGKHKERTEKRGRGGGRKKSIPLPPQESLTRRWKILERKRSFSYNNDIIEFGI